MKRKTKLLGFLFALALVAGLLAGCSDGSSGDTYSYGYGPGGAEGLGAGGNGKTKIINASVTSQGNAVKFGESSTNAMNAMILPDGATSTGDYTYYLASKTLNASTYTDIKEVTVTGATGDDYTGTFPLGLDIDSYELILYAIPTADVPAAWATTPPTTTADLEGVAVLTGYATVDLRYVSDVSFYLIADSTSGTGSLEITVATATGVAFPSGFQAYAEIYDMSGKLVSNSKCLFTIESDGTITQAYYDMAASPATAGTTKPSTLPSIASGNYNFVVTLDNNDTTNPKKYKWSDSILVLANQISKGDVLIQDIIGKRPKAPYEFLAARKVPLPERNQYEVKFAWSDTSNVETGFEIEILKVDDKQGATATFPVMPQDDAQWATALGAYCVDNTTPVVATCDDDLDDVDTVEIIRLNTVTLPQFANSRPSGVSTPSTSYSRDGTVSMNATHLSFLLPLEHRYVARICAVNDEGKSDWTYLTLPTTVAAAKTTKIAKGTTTLPKGQASSTVTADTDTPIYTLTNSADELFASDVATLNLYKIVYNLNGGAAYVLSSAPSSSAADGDPVPNISTTVYRSQKTDSTGVTTPSITGAAHASEVEILTPDSIMTYSGGPAGLSEKDGTQNTSIDTAGGTLSNNYLMLLRGQAFWQRWKLNSESGNDYTTSAQATPPVLPGAAGYDATPPSWKDYKNLYLIAVYDAGAQGTVSVQNVANYVLKPEYLTLNTFTNGACTSPATITDLDLTDTTTHDFTATTTGGVVTTVKGMTLKLNTSAKYTNSGTDVPLVYDNMHIVIAPTNGGAVIYEADGTKPTSTNIGTAVTFTVNLSQAKPGKYTMIITATKGYTPYTVSHEFELFGQ